MELHPWLEKLRPNQYERIVDIGASEGYYAVGMAHACRCLRARGALPTILC
jgi:protein-L-isoaspartate O-methyltransferase